MDIGFDPKKYLEEQSKYILERVDNYDKLYLEFGGKLLFDMHAKRVLPGYDENAKLELLKKLRDKLEIIICLYAGDLERNKIRSDFGISYDMDVYKLIDDLRSQNLQVNSVVITRYDNQPSANVFINKLAQKGIKVYKHQSTKGYPTDIDIIVSEEGYGKNPYIETTKPIIAVTGPGPGSGKLATCLSQLYHEHKQGNHIGYSKFETFPVWNLPLKHPVNIAYEAATADLKDVNMLDSFHMEAYDNVAVNYNRDMETFPVLKRIIEKITETDANYKSPTDMGVNCIASGIIDDQVIREASRQEIIRRYFKTSCEYKKGLTDQETLDRIKLIMDEMNIKITDRKVVEPAWAYLKTLEETQQDQTSHHVVSIELSEGHIVTGRNSDTMDASAAAILNAIKHYSKIEDEVHLLAPAILDPIIRLKKENLGNHFPILNSEEVLLALSISAAFNPIAQVALDSLCKLKNCQAHSTSILSTNNENTYRKLELEVTCDPSFSTDSLFYNN